MHNKEKEGERLSGVMKKTLEVMAVGTRKGSDGWEKMKTEYNDTYM